MRLFVWAESPCKKGFERKIPMSDWCQTSGYIQELLMQKRFYDKTLCG